jgi:hypothetical protein
MQSFKIGKEAVNDDADFCIVFQFAISQLPDHFR